MIRKPETKFARWLLENMWENGLTQQDVANKLRTTKQSINNQYHGRVNVTFAQVVAYCWIFGNKDDPEEIWKMIEEEVSC